MTNLYDGACISYEFYDNNYYLQILLTEHYI